MTLNYITLFQERNTSIGRKSCYRCGHSLIGFVKAGSYESDILSFLIAAEILPSQNRMNGATILEKHFVTQKPPSSLMSSW
jgi:hypothetical protein